MKPRRALLPAVALVTAVYFFLAGATGFRIAVHETEISHLMDEIAGRQDLNHVTNMDVNLNPSRMGVVTSFFLRISQKDIVSRQQAAENQHEIVDEIDQLRAEIRDSSGDSILLVGLTLIYLLLALPLLEPGPTGTQSHIYFLLAASLICFAIGISCPVLTAVVKGEHLLIGGFIIETASKGIVSTVISLFKSGSWMISVLLAGFSIGIPVFKATAVLITSLSRSRAQRARIGRALESIGKWSLTDVLVAAILLGCFSLNAIQEPDGGVFAVPRFALGFFIFYCVLAARTSYLLRRTGDTKVPVTDAAWWTVIVNGALLLVALGGGVAAGATVHWDVPFSRNVSEDSLIKLVRTHTELVQRNYHVQSGRQLVVPMDLPFKGKLDLEIKAKGSEPLTVWLEKEAVDAHDQPIDKPAREMPGFRVEGVAKYDHADQVPGGKYQLVIEAGRSSASFSVHASLDP